MTQPPHEAVGATSIGVCPTCGVNLTVGDRYCGGCGSPVPQAADARLLLDLQDVTRGDYEILGVLGRGGMGMVYLAHDISLNKKVAIKVLPPDLLQGEMGVERFRREARIAASLRHRHITSVFALKETTKLLFFVMEYVEGRTLDAVLRDEGQLPIDAAGAVIHDAMSALTYAHRREVIHRDLKPGNIIVDVEGLAMITDFGVAKVTTVQGITTTGSTVGSPKYMSPEQWSGKATHLTDQYALGCVAYELVAGRAPFEGETLEQMMKQQLFDAPEPLLELRKDCPPQMAEAISRMLEKDPQKRWPNLEAARSAMGLHAPTPDDAARTRLAEWAKRGHDVRALPKTPRSPIPISRAHQPQAPPPITTAPTAPLIHTAPRDAHGSRRAWLIGMPAAIVVGLAVWLLLRPASGGGGGQQGGTPATIAIQGASGTIGVGERITLSAQARDGAGNALTSVPITWSTSDSAIALVSSDGGLQARAAGTVRLTASGGGKSTAMTLTVRPAAVASVTVTPSEARLSPGETARLTVAVRGRDGTELPGRRVEWTSNAPSVASVSPSGVVSAQMPGRATVAASSEGASGTVAITVEPRRPVVTATLDISPGRASIKVGETVSLVASLRGERARARTVWTSADNAIAQVSSGGVVIGVSPGTTTITATNDRTVSASATVTVSAVAPAAPGVLQMLIAPWATVTIDGVSRGQRTRGADSLAANVAHRIRFERPGFITIDTVVTLQSGQSHLLQIQMKPRPQ